MRPPGTELVSLTVQGPLRWSVGFGLMPDVFAKRVSFSEYPTKTPAKTLPRNCGPWNRLRCSKLGPIGTERHCDLNLSIGGAKLDLCGVKGCNSLYQPLASPKSKNADGHSVHFFVPRKLRDFVALRKARGMGADSRQQAGRSKSLWHT
jgi:hypothetical protein